MSALNFLFQNIILAYLSQGKQADGPTIARDLIVYLIIYFLKWKSVALYTLV